MARGSATPNQLSFDGNQTVGDLKSRLEEFGAVEFEQNISDYLVDQTIEAYADFTDNVPEATLETYNKMIVAGNDSAWVCKRLDNPRRRFAGVNSGDFEANKSMTNIYRPGKPAGYTNRSMQIRALRELRDMDVADDPKEFYHSDAWTTRDIQRQFAHYNWGAVPAEVNRLQQKLDVVHRLASTAMQGFLRNLEDIHPDLPKYVTPQDLQTSPIRINFYHPGQGTVLASKHSDKGFFTDQIAESHRGLRVMNPQSGEMQLIEREEPSSGLFFPAWAFQNSFPNSPFKAAEHDVIDDDRPNDKRKLYGKNVVRWSMIFFVNSHLAGYAADRSLTHK